MSQRDRQTTRPRGPMMGGPGGRGMMPGDKPKDFKKTFKRLTDYIKPQRISILIVAIFAAISTVFTIVSPKVMGKATSKLFEGIMLRYAGIANAPIDYTYISRILLILIGLYTISAIFSYIQHYMMAGVAQKIVYKMRNDISIKVNKLPLKYFDSRTYGEVLSRVVNDVDTISTSLQQSLSQIISSATTIVGILIMMLSISPVMTLITLVTLPLSLIFTVFITKRSQKFFAKQQKSLGDLNGHIEEMYAGHAIVKAFGREDESVEKFEKISEDIKEYNWRAQFMSGSIMPVLNFVGNLGYVAICIVGGVLATKRSIEIGDIQAFIQYSKQFTQPIVQTANISNILQSTVAAAERVFELLDETEEVPETDNPIKLENPHGDVRFESVKFGYSDDKILIEDMNIDVKSGQTIAIAGPTGAGKTTLVNLLMRFYELNGGKITIDGVDIVEMRRSDLRGLFGMVLQDTWLFNGTIRDNIAYGKRDATYEEIMNAAVAAEADHFIRTLPDGYDTVINEEATNISQGQKQLLTIARAILADPLVLILDEATSSVDTRTEVMIQNAMKQLMKDRTNFVIAHRLSTIRNADCILVMRDGAIVEKGTHTELMALDGFYSELYNSQFVADEDAI